MSEPRSIEIEINLDEVAPAAELLCDADRFSRVTRPYEVPVEMFGEMTRTSGMFTLPVSLDELPDDCYPTEVYFVGIDV